MESQWKKKRDVKNKNLDNDEALHLYRKCLEVATMCLEDVTTSTIAGYITHYSITDRSTAAGILHSLLSVTSIISGGQICYRPIAEGRQRITPAMNFIQIGTQGKK